ncbi:MAG: NAD(+)/NADH kinase [Candidatus Didemnitutus sp.]|jgi:NAD+ kinase|nr:NAD(+)/NADH kinase [Candidatus Didemnitutus sp.]
MSPFRRLAFVVNPDRPGAAELADELLEIAGRAGVKQTKLNKGRKLPRGYLKGCDAVCVIGGDGTLLGVVRSAAREGIPIIGVNRGSLGFLTAFSADEARMHFAALLGGEYRLAHRSLLECKIGPGRRDVALNDVVIKNEVNSRLMRIEVYADDELVTDYYADGLVFSTPTGSTAYNLAAGGPIIHPAAQAIAMTPISPHTLSNRSIIFRDTVKLRVVNRTDDARLLVAMDGQRNSVVTGSSIEVSLAPRRLALAQPKTYSHFAVMRSKLKWSGGLTEKR